MNASTGVINTTNDGGYVICHATLSYATPFKQGIYLFKLNQFGDTVFTNTFYQNNNAYFGRSIHQANDNGFLISYGGNSASNMGLIKTNASGDLSWSKYYYSPAAGPAIGYYGMILKSGNFFCSGGNNSNFITHCKTDQSGNLVYGIRYSLAAFSNNQLVAHSSYECKNKDIITTGYAKNGANSYDVLVIRADSVGNLKYAKTYGSDNFLEAGYKIAELSDNSVVIVGDREINAGYEKLILRTDANGNPIYFKQTTDTSGWTNNLIVDQNDNLYFGGFTRYNMNLAAGSLIKCDAIGNTIWSKGFINGVYCNNIVRTSDNGFVLGGLTPTGSSSTVFDCFVIKTDSSVSKGCDIFERPTTFYSKTCAVSDLTLTTINDMIAANVSFITRKGTNISTKCQEFPTTKLIAVYEDFKVNILPNPVSNILSFQFNNEYFKGEASITNLVGEIVRKSFLVDSNNNSIDIADLIPGVYIIRLRNAQGNTITHKFMKE